MSNDRIKQVIVVRRDLKLSAGEIAAQAADASLKVLLDRLGGSRLANGLFISELRLTEELERWVHGNPARTVAGCDSDIELRSIYDEARAENIPCSLVRDKLKTERSGEPAITCVAVGPAAQDKVDAITSHLKPLE